MSRQTRFRIGMSPKFGGVAYDRDRRTFPTRPIIAGLDAAIHLFEKDGRRELGFTEFGDLSKQVG